MGGKCPGCEKNVSYVNLQPMDVHMNGRNAWNGVSYQCPHCKTILGVGIDPVALKTETIAGVVDGLRR